jgi:hypothetical protein
LFFCAHVNFFLINIKEKGFYLIKGLFFAKKLNIYNKETTLHKSILNMENILTNFDENSRAVIKELVKYNKKMTDLISKLQSARNTINNKVNFMNTLTQEIKK